MDNQYNISAQFLLPCLMLDLSYFMENNIEFNTYISCPDLSNDIVLCNPVYLLINLETLGRRYSKVVDKLTGNKHFIIEQRINNIYSLFCYEFPRELTEDYTKIINGEYSRTSDKYKSCFRKYEEGSLIRTAENKMSRKLTFWHQVFNKDYRLRKFQDERLGIELNPDNELWDKLDIEKESLIIQASFPENYLA